MTRRPADMLGPAQVLTDVYLPTVDDLNGAHRGDVKAAARILTTFGVAEHPDQIITVLAAVFNDMGLPPLGRAGARWERWQAAFIDDVARRLAWLTDPTDDAAVCYYCDTIITAPRADLALGEAHCDGPDCGKPRKVTLPAPAIRAADRERVAS